MSPSRDPRAPVLVGTGSASQRLDDPAAAAEPLVLMERALRAAARDAGSDELLGRIERVAVPRGRWDYRDPGRLLARTVGAPAAATVLAEVGVLQQSLIADAAARVAAGEIAVAAVVGGEAGHRLRSAARSGLALVDTPDDGEPDVHLVPADELLLDVERRHGLNRAVNVYAVLDSAVRHRRGLGADEARDRTAATYARFSEIAAANPEAWRPVATTAGAIREPGPRNPMLAFPYSRAHASSWSVDQAGALLLCSTAVADELGVPAHRRVHPVVSAESTAMTAVSARPDLGDSPGTRAVCTAALRHAGLDGSGLGPVDLYSPFPVAVELFAEALGLPEGRDLTVTGGMPWAGGPFNNYVLQSTHALARRLRADGGTGAVTCVSGLMTKQAAALWSADPPPRPFADLDVSVTGAEREVVADAAGAATVAGYTVLHIPDRPLRAVAVLDLPDGRRTVARCEDPAVAAGFEGEDRCGHRVTVETGTFGPVGRTGAAAAGARDGRSS